jgi:nucleotide-binding universal stress UspA family protein
MAFKDILLHVDNSPSFLHRLDLAVNLARTHGAHLKGLYILSHSYYAPRHGQVASEAARKAEELFCQSTAQAGIAAEWICADWPVVGVSVTEILNMYAYYADLVIIGQPDHSSPDRSIPLDLPERLGLGAGRPLLVVPYAGSFPSIGHRVMIAWKSGREAVRAVNDALPLLEKADSVSVVTISQAGRPDGSDAENALNICTHLVRHAVQATHDHIHASTSMSIGDMLLNHACEQKMDLLVMGAYAQSRRGVFMHSPVARHLLNFMTVPILISH